MLPLEKLIQEILTIYPKIDIPENCKHFIIDIELYIKNNHPKKFNYLSEKQIFNKYRRLLHMEELSRVKTWITARGEAINICDMNKLHLIRTIQLLNNKGKQEFPNVWQGLTKEDWLIVLRLELSKRTEI